jgi:hypothetical protein
MGWNNGVFGNIWDLIDSSNWRRDTPVFGSGLSNRRLVDISQVIQEPNQALSADWRVIRDAYFCLLPDDSIVLKGVTNRIFVPSGNLVDEEPYHLESF